MDSKSDNIDIMMNDKADDLVEESKINIKISRK